MSTNLELIRRYEPVLAFSADGKKQPEYFFPMAVENYVAHCALYCKDRQVLPPGQVMLQKLAQLGDDAGNHYLAYATREAISRIPASARGHEMMMSRFQGHMALSARMPRRDADALREKEAPNALFVPARDTDRPGEDVRNVLAAKGVPGDWEAAALLDARDWPGDSTLAPPGHKAAEEMVDVVFLGDESDTRPVAKEWGGISQLPLQVLEQARRNYDPYKFLPPVYYYRVMRDHEGYLVLQYWFFYAYNDWGTAHDGWNDHEGDWEGMMIFLRDEDTPEYVAYSKHFRFPRTPAPFFFLGPDQSGWGDEELEKRYQRHPVVHVACGSHASYVELKPEPHGIPYDILPFLQDYALGNQRRIGPGQRIRWARPINLEQHDWALKFRGRWGALWRRVPGFGTDGPFGPVCKPRWNEPVKWGLARHIG